MVSIVISACLLADPGVCKEHRIPLKSQWDAARCYRFSQPHFAKWSSQHPGWTIKSWRCEDNDVQDL